MTDDGDGFDVVGDLSPTELARHLAWPPRLVHTLIDEGAVVRTGTGWHIDTTALSRHWAQAHWGPATASDARPVSRPRTDENDGES